MADFSILIRSWFRQNQRNLPWRDTSDPYKIWLSEIILQQTRVDQGMAYYLKFIDHFPTIKDLANADQNTVLNLWQGLGYYSRARNMHFSAKQVVEQFNGEFPTTYKDILSLKGVGEYTAAAIGSIAYGLPHAVVDGNVYRVLSRYLEIDTPIDSTKGKKEFKMVADELLDKNHPGDHNQALMEIGALICTPRSPKCDVCPVREGCISREKNTQLNYPIKSKKTKVRNRYFNYLIVTNGKAVILKKRQGNGIWEGLYDFPLIETEKVTEITKQHLKRFVPIHYEQDGSLKHILSHQIIHANFWLVNVKAIEIEGNEIEVDMADLSEYPMPQLLIRYMEGSDHFTSE